MLIARVQHYWPHVWRDPSYRTWTGIIPFPLFWLYAANLGALVAFQRVQHTRAVGNAIALSFGKKEDGLPEPVRADLADAYLSPRAPR